MSGAATAQLLIVLSVFIGVAIAALAAGDGEDGYDSED